MGEIYSAAMPFIFCSLFLVLLMIIFPGIALWLPGFMN
ncbi:MAG: TRAP-type mannitol/chloroaromatic compound transport system permease large subunit [Reinekea sp.]|jgi:TRAP-type mannitol/chloroaromatic compound transport system permease large subunit